MNATHHSYTFKKLLYVVIEYVTTDQRNSIFSHDRPPFIFIYTSFTFDLLNILNSHSHSKLEEFEIRATRILSIYLLIGEGN